MLDLVAQQFDNLDLAEVAAMSPEDLASLDEDFEALCVDATLYAAE